MKKEIEAQARKVNQKLQKSVEKQKFKEVDNRKNNKHKYKKKIFKDYDFSLPSFSSQYLSNFPIDAQN